MTTILSSTGEWITVQPPKAHDPSWQAQDIMRYAVLFQSAVEKGYSPQRAEVIAESIVNRRLYPGLVYSSRLEQDILSLIK